MFLAPGTLPEKCSNIVAYIKRNFNANGKHQTNHRKKLVKKYGKNLALYRVLRRQGMVTSTLTHRFQRTGSYKHTDGHREGIHMGDQLDLC